jgi:PAS domain S-box-containing protein
MAPAGTTMSEHGEAERLRRIVESTPDLILNLDLEARIRFVNRDLPHRTVEEALGKSAFDCLLGPDVERLRDAFGSVLETGAPRSLETRCFGGGEFLTRLIPMKCGQQVESVLVVATDVSEVRHARDESLATIAHDFNNLLTGILGSAGLASVKVPPGSAAREQLARILAAAAEGAALTSKLTVHAAPTWGTERHRRTETVLVIDDEESVRAVARESLEKSGYRVLTAADGSSALALFEERATEIDAVLLDVTMPGMSGEETLEAMRRLKADVRVVLTSGHGEQDLARRFDIRAGFVPKPFRAIELTQRIAEALAH